MNVLGGISAAVGGVGGTGGAAAAGGAGGGAGGGDLALLDDRFDCSFLWRRFFDFFVALFGGGGGDGDGSNGSSESRLAM